MAGSRNRKKEAELEPQMQLMQMGIFLPEN
jgi:hypothetical protein